VLAWRDMEWAESVARSAFPPLSGPHVLAFRRAINCWRAKNTRDFPWRRTKDPFKILVAEVLLQATYSGKVVPVYEAITGHYPNAFALSKASAESIQEAMRPLGLTKRGRMLVDIARILVESHDGEVPVEESALQALPGVGPYTSSAIRNFAFDIRGGLADTNVVRLLQRFFGLAGSPELYRGAPSSSLRRAAKVIVPRVDSRGFNLALIDFGAAVCRLRKPKCEICPLAARCVYRRLKVATTRD
jgi:A/G-specific adenine glycosylase